jgi:ribA/ribD-fused uncharacterized protein
MTNPITSFTGKYRFLSNFYYAPVILDGEVYPTVEHAYQAAKRTDPEYRQLIRICDKPGDAKRLGRNKQGPDWKTKSLDIMLNLLRQKFKNPDLKRYLLNTEDAELIEGNTWNDTFWGQCPVGVGENHLGKLLIQVREEKFST